MSREQRRPLSYADAGVDIDAGNALVERIKPLVASTRRDGVVAGLGGFGGLFSLDTGKYPDPVLVSGTDGVGTKLMLARRMGVHDTIGIDLVAMCVNDILTLGAEPLFFLDYFATGKLENDIAVQVIEGIAEGCRQAGCALIGGETAEMPGMYEGSDYDLAGFCVGVVNRESIIDGRRIRPGHRVLGLASSGPHSNGYSLIRRILEVSDAAPRATLAGGTGETLGEALLAPTRIYSSLPEIARTGQVDGLAHITGGGLVENVSRILPEGMGLAFRADAWPRPPVFRWLQEQGQVEEQEMLRTFNCGIGMTLIVASEHMTPVTTALEAAGETVYDIGRVCPEPGVRFSER